MFKCNRIRSILLALMLFIILAGSGGCGGDGCNFRDSGGTINLAWDSNTEPNLAGYKVYYGRASRTYGPGIDVGNVTSFALTGLIKGQRCFIAVKAYNTSKQESDFSDEVSGIAK